MIAKWKAYSGLEGILLSNKQRQNMFINIQIDLRKNATVQSNL